MRVVRDSLPLSISVAGWLVGMITTALIIGTPYLVFAYHSPELHLVLDSVDSGVALLAAYLVYGRFTRSRRLQDLLLAEGLFLLGVAGVGMTLALELLAHRVDDSVGVWLPLTLRVAGAGVVLAAALSGERVVKARWGGWAWAAPWLVATVGFVLLWALGDRLPAALAESPPMSAERPVITGHPLLLGAQAVSAIFFAAASLLFTRQAMRSDHGRRDELVRWLGAAFALAAFARVNYVLFPSLYSGWLYTGDLLRTGCYLLLLIGAAREISHYWSAQARAAVLEDRRRLARELHDGVVQELAYIRSEARGGEAGPAAQERIVVACDRALDEARSAVDALGRSTDEPLGFALHRAAQQVAERYHAGLDVELDDSVRADQEQRHALVRITREAVSNAIRHGKVDRVQLRLVTDRHGRHLVVRDHGLGFDRTAASRAGSGYGLTSMAERAQAFDGSLNIDSRPGVGTTVEVTW
ncbi:sensor histidine kinase [Humibacillus xanthopallidus]|uniref:histidine kinase n=1 Tax=Humibacillus xanthopallidus TaxID=412689 RepID=A0A543I1U9_9MICO|nr:ATP-binding protein [Humibacillus xanthopallidus]TQM64563.1 signal transduction histidine kinase [Humibacillus xanthopallidus]